MEDLAFIVLIVALVSIIPWSVEVPLKKQSILGSPEFWSPIFSDYSVIYIAAESVLSPIAWVINKAIKRCWPKCQSSTDW